VLVRVYAAGVNPADWKFRAGLLKDFLPLTLPYVPGYDLAGVVEKVGPG
jgi:NADPH:quinone reductase-like Zn-dependent oxidoreductase